MDLNIIHIYYNKNIKLFCKDHIDVILKTGWGMRKIKMHDLIFEMIIPNIKDYLSFVTFLDYHMIVYTS